MFIKRNPESKRTEMGWCESEVAYCKRHQNRKQLQGVCPFCLRERLSQLAAATSLKKTSMLSRSRTSSPHSSSPAGYSSASASSSNNKSPSRRRHNRVASEIIGSISFVLSAGSNIGLKKSRSIAFVPSNFVGERKSDKKKQGFWSKLLHRDRKKDIFMGSRNVSVREA